MSHSESSNIERERAKQIIEYTGTHLFLTGKAGTGKTTFLRELKHDAPKRMIVLAPTGIAAINAGGSTIHSFFQLPFSPFIPDENYKQMDFKLRKKKIELIRSLDLIVIDEISMVRADLLDQIDAVLRQYRNRFQPFGGVQLLMIGDLQQLAPVAKEEEWNLLSQYYDSPYFFSSHALQQTQYVTVELQTVYRQSDPVFLELLNRIRTNTADAKVLEQLNKRYIPNFVPNDADSYIRLVTHNWQAQQINESELAKIKEKTYTFAAKVEGAFPQYSYPTDETLSLKRGAQVMFVKNDTEKRYYNGTLGEIIAIDEESCTVRTADRNIEVKLEREEWQNTKYALNEKTKTIEEKVEGSFHQFPVKLAWAITIHKSQGLTFERAIIDAHSAFAHGQTYVALSRCKTLEGMVLSAPIPASAIIQDRAVCDFNKQVELQQPGTDTIDKLRHQHCLKLVSDLFDFSVIRHSLNGATRLMEESFYKLFPETLKKYQSCHSSFNDNVIAVAEKFSAQYQRLITQDDSKEISDTLQERIRKGANYFNKMLLPLLEIVKQTSLPSDNKEINKKASNVLHELQLHLSNKSQLLAYVETCGFSIQGYQKCRALLAAGQPITPKGEVDVSALPEKQEKTKASEKFVVPEEIQHPDLYRKLNIWRNKIAAEIDIPVYLIVQGKALLGISNLLPMDKQTLKMIPYFGEKSVENYGEAILEIVHRYVKEKGITPVQPQLYKAEVQPTKAKSHTKTAHGTSGTKVKTSHVSLALFKERKTIKQIAEERNLTTGTIYKHLDDCIGEGLLQISDVIPQERIQAIQKYIQNNTSENGSTLTEIKNGLGEDYDFSEIRMVMNHMEK